jgi:hypothetical protein
MPEQPTEEDLRKWHRRFAVESNNRAWTLSEKRELTTEEMSELLDAAHAASHHWSKIGTAAQIAQADLLLGRVHALLGHGELAMKFATAAFDSITSRDCAPWEVAFAHAILANAAAASGNAEMHAQHYAEAKVLGESLMDPQDKSLFLATFDLIPAPLPSRGTG